MCKTKASVQDTELTPTVCNVSDLQLSDCVLFDFFFFFAVLESKLRTYTLSHSTSLFFF
jgi:hypothetical protein